MYTCPDPCDDRPTSFDPDFYARIRSGTRRSAGVVVPIVYALVRPRSVVDVGGGEGWWAAEFAALGVRAVCIDDGAIATPAAGVEHVAHDIHNSLLSLGSFDLALCLEVLEHIDDGAGARLVADLCTVSKRILFSAAVPGQGGVGHVNEQWPSYWVARFDEYGFRCSGALRWQLWDDDRVEYWYRQNLMLATSEPDQHPELFDTPLAEPWGVVHPETFARVLAT